MGPEVLAALGRARAAGLRLLLVTGRTFFDLTRVCERLDLFDTVIAENGGVVYLPAVGAIRDLAPPPPRALLAELDRRGIFLHVGRVVVGMARADEAGVREAMAASGASLAFSYNRDALMLLPVGISKGTALRQVVGDLGLSFHDVLALGDAENDLELFEVCGGAGCPASAVAEVRARADWVFEGEDGPAIARAILGPIVAGNLPPSRVGRAGVALGWAAKTSEPVTVAGRGVNLLIQGDLLSGKSWLAGGVVERLLGHAYALCVLDPEGDFQVLGRLAGVRWAAVGDEASLENALGHFERDPSACVVADLSTLPHARRLALVERGLRWIRQLRRRLGLPHWVFLDEAHYFLHREGVAAEAVGAEDRGFCLITYRPSWLRDALVKSMDTLILSRTTAPEELAFLRALLAGPFAGCADVVSALPDLPRGTFLVVQRREWGEVEAITFLPVPRSTAHIRHRRKYADAVLPSEHRFHFRRARGGLVATAESLTAFRRVLAAADDDSVSYHAGRRDFSRWISDVFSEEELAGHVRKLESRWGRGEVANLREVMEQLLAHHYGTELS